MTDKLPENMKKVQSIIDSDPAIQSVRAANVMPNLASPFGVGQLQDFVEAWIAEHRNYVNFDPTGNANGVHFIVEEDLRAFLAKFVLCKPEIAGWMFQHDETGRTMIVDDQDVRWGFERHNPRLQKIHAMHAPATKEPQP